MENKFRNEMEIELAGEKILLRPTFENVASLESMAGSLAYLGWKFSRGLSDGKNMPGLTDFAQIIYHCQAATKSGDPTRKQYSLEEIWDKVQQAGVILLRPLTEFIARVTAGDRTVNELSERQKKSSSDDGQKDATA